MQLQYTHDATRANRAATGRSGGTPLEEQICANCRYIGGDEGDLRRPCEVFNGKLVAAGGWCKNWRPPQGREIPGTAS
ncbi:MAG: high-potential iron-sulfur protein [Candidatus Thiosymbion ectosymbiont of Robbea hypermnestra]|nr:high-potential iron-sulfur protein [Candidatus Thiosymbion ectosymbiont of Robbea hypermnestra]